MTKFVEINKDNFVNINTIDSVTIYGCQVTLYIRVGDIDKDGFKPIQEHVKEFETCTEAREWVEKNFC